MVRNALANVASGASAALLAIVLPPVLVRALSAEVYATWALILQIGAYTALLNFGIQTAVGRFVARYDETGETGRRDELVSTAWAVLSASAAAGILAMLLLSAFLPEFFPRIPAAVRREAQGSLAWVGTSLALGLPFSVFMGIFIGRQSNGIPAVIQVVSRLATGVGIYLVCIFSPTLLSMAKVFAGVNFCTYAFQYLVHRRWNGDCDIRPGLAGRSAWADLWDYCFSLTVWSLASLMVSGLSLVIVGRLDFGAVAAFAIASGLVTFISGLQGAVFNVLIPVGAVLQVDTDGDRLRRMLLNSTRYGVLLLLASGLPLFVFGDFLLKYYVGPKWIPQTLPLLQLLVVGNLIRLSAVPYVSLLIGTGQQRLVIASPLLEGFTNLLSSVFLGLRFGARGVAVGTILGAVVGLVFHILYNFPRTDQIPARAGRFVREGLLLPLVPALPWAAWVFRDRILPSGGSAAFPLFLAVAGSTLYLLWKFVLRREEHEALAGFLRRRGQGADRA